MLPGEDAGERTGTAREGTALQLRWRRLGKRAVQVVGMDD